ncbi:MAG: S8 family peptidase, partial [Candidatus Dormibacteraeota bacterium]|nr:S8 family peptidase [Candidatus Dormibacteraeota bacterium]
MLAATAAIGSLLPMALSVPASAAGIPDSFGHRVASRLSPGEVLRLSAQANLKSIVIFKNQHPELPARPALQAARAQAVDSDQAAVKSELSQLHAPNLKTFHVVNAVAATISKAESDRLAANPAVRAVVPDATRKLVLPAAQSAGATAAGPGAQPAAAELQQICPPNPSVPLLEPEALQVMNVEFQPGTHQPAAHDLVNGTGIKVGIIADGLDINNPDLVRNGKSIVFDYQDFSGFGNNAPTDGRESFLDSGAIASQGNQAYDLSKFVNPAHPLPPGCNIKIKGVAPGATLAIMNAFAPAAFNSQIVQAIDRLVTVDKVDVLNESFGANVFPDKANDPTALADDAAVAAGVTVIVSTGDAGPTNTIGSPASDPGIIAAGGSTTYRVYRQATRYGVQLSAGGWESNNITALSSAGTTQLGPRTVDVVAPGDRGWELCSTDVAHYFGCKDFDNNNIPQPIWAAGGTSLSSPLTSGTAALVIEAYAKTHNGARPSPDLVKRIIMSSAQDLGAPAIHQGAGLVDSLKAVQLAESIADDNGAPNPQGSTLLVSKPALTANLAAGETATFHVDVTNTGAAAQTVTPALVKLGSGRASDDTGSVALNAGNPTFIDDRGRTARYQLHQFNVPARADNLNGEITWNAQQKPGSAAYQTLFDPSGAVAAYSLISADASGYGHVEVRHPAAGTWTAAIFTISTSQTYTGTVRFDYFTQRFVHFGSVVPAQRTLGPGQTAGFT